MNSINIVNSLISFTITQYGSQNKQLGWLIPSIILGTIFLGVFILIFLTYFPKLENVRVKNNLRTEIKHNNIEKNDKTVEEGNKALYIAIRLLEIDERKVVKAIIDAGGAMLQKDISWKLGFSRVKTHRVLVKLLSRGVVTAQKYYNTNKIELADWLKNGEGLGIENI